MTMHAATISIIIPVYNERKNISYLVNAISHVVKHCRYEIIFVDDRSEDGTIEEVWRYARHNARIRGILRLHRRGLASAVIEGMLSSSADILVVMDGDGQHDPQHIPQLIAPLNRKTAALCIGSRYLGDGNTLQGFNQPWRRFLSQWGTHIARLCSLAHVSDPLSGFFAIRRSCFIPLAPYLFPHGFKILLDILTLLPPSSHVEEIAIRFHKRRCGDSKLTFSTIAHFLLFLSYLPFRKLRQKMTSKFTAL